MAVPMPEEHQELAAMVVAVPEVQATMELHMTVSHRPAVAAVAAVIRLVETMSAAQVAVVSSCCRLTQRAL